MSDTQALFTDNLCRPNTERQAFTGPKGKQLSAFKHGRQNGPFTGQKKLVAMLIPTCRQVEVGGDLGAISPAGQKPHLSHRDTKAFALGVCFFSTEACEWRKQPKNDPRIGVL